MPEDDRFIGQNVSQWRRARRMTQETLAGLVGVDRTYINHIEKGRRAVDKRELLYGLAEALSVQVTDLTGQPYGPADRKQVAARAAVSPIEHALMAAGTGPAPGQLRPPQALLGQAELTLVQRMAGDYAAMGRLVPGLITELHAHAAAGREPERVAAALTRVLVATAIGMKELGFTTLAYLAATQAAHAAQTPADAAAAAYATSQVLLAVAAVDKATVVAETALDAHGGTDDATRQMRGMLHLQAALCSTALARLRGAAAPGALASAAGHAAEARTLAAGTGEGTAYGLRFGPTNAAVWDMSLALERDDPDLVAALAPEVDLTQLDTPNRLARVFLEQGRAYARLGKDGDALGMLLRAEKAAPVYTRGRPVVRELTGQLLRDARRRAAPKRLVEFAERVGASAA